MLGEGACTLRLMWHGPVEAGTKKIGKKRNLFRQVRKKFQKNSKAYSTSTSHVVPHHSTTLAVHRLTSRFGWDVVYSASYGRKRSLITFCRSNEC